VETIVAPNTNVVKGGILIRFVANLGHGSNGVLVGRNLNKSSGILITISGVVGTFRTVFNNLIMITHVNKIANWSSMNSIIAKRYKITNAENPRGRYWKPSIITIGIPNHINGHSVRPNKVAFKYVDLKKMLIQIFMSECSILQWKQM
jgi:hypothetical protein